VRPARARDARRRRGRRVPQAAVAIYAHIYVCKYVYTYAWMYMYMYTHIHAEREGGGASERSSAVTPFRVSDPWITGDALAAMHRGRRAVRLHQQPDTSLSERKPGMDTGAGPCEGAGAGFLGVDGFGAGELRLAPVRRRPTWARHDVWKPGVKHSSWSTTVVARPLLLKPECADAGLDVEGLGGGELRLDPVHALGADLVVAAACVRCGEGGMHQRWRGGAGEEGERD
jgi:hypothetical protein